MITSAMSRADSVPADDDILCAHCGYTLNGLPDTGRCPECGEWIADSTTADIRQPPAYETTGRFWQTTAKIIFTPARFFRSLNTRGDEIPARRFSRRHHILAAILLGLAVGSHMKGFWPITWHEGVVGSSIALQIVLIGLTFLCLRGTTILATWLTRLEGKYWGYRLPTIAVRRTMHYHAAQLLPVAIVAFVTIVGYGWLYRSGWVSVSSEVPYLYTLSVEVVVLAIYLFFTYWIAMKNILYANR